MFLSTMGLNPIKDDFKEGRVADLQGWGVILRVGGNPQGWGVILKDEGLSSGLGG